MDKITYITTPLYYVNAEPHIGHAYTQVAADCLARYYRQRGRSVHFLTGTDEHGEKINQAAQQEGVGAKEFVDRGAEKYLRLWKELSITNDQFIRTTDTVHENAVSSIVSLLIEKNYIYKGMYEGWYCVPCETFYTDTQIEESFCPDCVRDVKKISQESYFFRLSEFQDSLLKHINENPQFIMPESRRNEIRGFLAQPLKDLSISRMDVSWGIPFPGDEKHTVYVWFDALINYISAAGYPDDMERFGKYWPADFQLLGKDILKFHAVIWPAVLLALGLELPRTVFAHGWWMVDGGKMSKSLGNVVDPSQVINEWGVDAFRYFLLRHVTFGLDGNYSESQFVSRYETDLANELGNLLSRVLSMIGKYSPGYDLSVPDGFDEIVINLNDELDGLYRELKFSLILEKIWGIIKAANVYVERSAPWKLAKDDPARLGQVLSCLFETLACVSVFISPFTPGTSEKMLAQLGLRKTAPGTPLSWGMAGGFEKAEKGDPLFPKRV